MKWDIPFTKEEIECKCGCGFAIVDEEFMERILVARYQSEYPFKIHSWCRCRQHNAAVGGTVLSSHPKGQAVDIEATNNGQRFSIIQGLYRAGFTRFGLGSDFIHVDDDDVKPIKRFWFDRRSIAFK